MPRKTTLMIVDDPHDLSASMRPRPDAAENIDFPARPGRELTRLQ